MMRTTLGLAVIGAASLGSVEAAKGNPEGVGQYNAELGEGVYMNQTYTWSCPNNYTCSVGIDEVDSVGAMLGAKVDKIKRVNGEFTEVEMVVVTMAEDFDKANILRLADSAAVVPRANPTITPRAFALGDEAGVTMLYQNAGYEAFGFSMEGVDLGGTTFASPLEVDGDLPASASSFVFSEDATVGASFFSASKDAKTLSLLISDANATAVVLDTSVASSCAAHASVAVASDGSNVAIGGCKDAELFKKADGKWAAAHKFTVPADKLIEPRPANLTLVPDAELVGVHAGQMLIKVNTDGSRNPVFIETSIDGKTSAALPDAMQDNLRYFKSAQAVYGGDDTLVLFGEASEFDYTTSPRPYLWVAQVYSRAKAGAEWKQDNVAYLNPTEHVPKAFPRLAVVDDKEYLLVASVASPDKKDKPFESDPHVEKVLAYELKELKTAETNGGGVPGATRALSWGLGLGIPTGLGLIAYVVYMVRKNGERKEVSEELNP